MTFTLISTMIGLAAASGQEMTSPPVPTTTQLRMMDMGLSQFMHFSVDPFSDIEHNCVGSNPKCIPASVFNPTNLSTDQWVETAVAFGAGEICLTAHHEGGFCLWDTNFTDYSVMHSPYGKDIVKQFVASCKKYGVKPCYYMGPNANGYLTNEKKVSGASFIEAQLGMLRELLTNYGTDYVSRLWWDHYPSACGGLAPCPIGTFPDAWPKFVKLVREVSPSTIICPGPDCDGHQGESGIARYPSWFPCTPQDSADGTVLTCNGHAPNASLTGFHPYEACATMHNGWFTKGDGVGGDNTYWSSSDIWDHYVDSVGEGWVNTLNAPPGTTGQIPQQLVDSMTTFGVALKSLLNPLSPPTTNATLPCSNSSTNAGLVIELDHALTFNAIITREDLSKGQRIVSYEIDYFDADSSSWKTFAKCSGDACTPGSTPTSKIPPTPRGTCGKQMMATNLVTDLPSSCHVAGVVNTSAKCEAICLADSKCNFWTWHDLTNIPTWAGKCVVREDATYANHGETKHVSGICNQTLPGDSSVGGGVHGESVGAQIIDFVPMTTTTKIALRCTSSMYEDNTAFISSLSVHTAKRPSE